MFRIANRLIFLFSLMIVAACGGGGGEESDAAKLGGDGCGSLSAKVFNGDECNQTARTPVVAMYALAQSGERAGLCSGTLVTVDDVLTSAHCLVGALAAFGDNFGGILVRVGGEELYVVDAAIHPYYDGTVGTPYDIAMVTLERVPNPAIGPLPILVSQLTLPGQRMSTFGYGTNNYGQFGALKSAEILIERLENGNLIASIESGASICQGDSGGPVVQVVDGVTAIIGVNSFGIGIPTSQQCAAAGATLSGFVDLQNLAIIDFIVGYAPDVAPQ
jgi:hypothetical protein